MKKRRRAKNTSTKTQNASKLALRKALQAPRTEAPPLKEVSYAEYKAAKREEKRNPKRNLKVKKVGEKKLYLQEHENCPALAKIRDDAEDAEGCHLYQSSSSRAWGGDGPGLEFCCCKKTPLHQGQERYVL